MQNQSEKRTSGVSELESFRRGDIKYLWYTWTEVCEDCGEVIRESGTFMSSQAPQREHVHCLSCMIDKLNKKDTAANLAHNASKSA